MIADVTDWVSLAAYSIAAVLCKRASTLAWLRREKVEGIFWQTTALVLALLAMTELLDLQTLITAIGREIAVSTGMYAQRRGAQFVFIVGLFLVAVVFGLRIFWWTKHLNVGVRFAIAGILFNGFYILARTASFHHLDKFLGWDELGFTLGSFLKIVGILIMAGAAFHYIANQQIKSKHRTNEH